MTTLLNGYGYRLIARLGNAADIPVLQPGEAGWDIDMKTFRVGDDTTTPPRIPTTKSIGNFDFSTSGTFKFTAVEIVAGGTVDGVDISKLNAANGFLVRKANNDYGNVTLVCGDNSLQITNGSGVNGNVDLRIHPDVLAKIYGGNSFLTSVATSDIMLGDGRMVAPLSVKAATTTQVGVSRFSTHAEVSAGVSSTTGVTPSSLLNLIPGSPVVLHLQSLMETDLTVYGDQTITGSGRPSNPLSVVHSTETQRGAIEIATQVELNNGSSDSTAITPAKLAGLASGSAMAIALKAALGIGSGNVNLSDIRMTGPGVVGRIDNTASQAPQVLPFATRNKIAEGSYANDYDVATQSTMKEFFPYAFVRTNNAPTSALPAPATVGRGTIAFDDSRSGLVVSDGTTWLNPRLGLSDLYSITSELTMAVNTVYALPVDVRRRYLFWGGSVQAYCNGSWIGMAAGNILTPPGLAWWSTTSGDIWSTSTIINPPESWGAFCAGNDGALLQLGGSGLHGMIFLSIAMGAGGWTGQVRAVTTNIKLRCLEAFPG